jgi:hypothetical protein
MTELPLPGGPGARQITTAFPQKGQMILQRTRPPLLETPFEVFDKGGRALVFSLLAKGLRGGYPLLMDQARIRRGR